MFCMTCLAAASPQGPDCSACGGRPLLAERFQLDGVCDGRPPHRVLTGLDLGTMSPVVVHLMTPDLVRDRQAFGQLRRELQVRERSPMPGVPLLITRVPMIRHGEFALAVVEEPVLGRTLAAEARIRPFDELEFLLDLRGLAVCLAWMHGQPHPLVAGPLRPEAITRTWTGRLVLQRFGVLAGTHNGHRSWGMADDLRALGRLVSSLLRLRPPCGVHAGPVGQADQAISAGTLGLVRTLDVGTRPKPPVAARAMVRRLDSLLVGVPQPRVQQSMAAPLRGK